MSQSSVPPPIPESEPELPIGESVVVTFADRTERLKAVTQLIRSIAPLIWAMVMGIVLLPLGGKYLLGQSLDDWLGRPLQRSMPMEMTVRSTDWSAVDRDIATALQTAHQQAETYAAQELAQWQQELEPRVDDFLDWYFDFFHQKTMELSTPFVWAFGSIQHRLNPLAPTAQMVVLDRLNAQFEQEFAKQVLVPQTAQLRLERITSHTITHYLQNLTPAIGMVQTRYKIPQGTWDRYLSDIALAIGQEGQISNLSLKTLAGGGTYLAAKPILAASIAKISGKASAKVAGSAAGKVAAKTGGAAAAELGASMLDPLIGIGIIVWDVMDYHRTVERDRPMLKANVMDYLSEVEQMLLNQADHSVMAAIQELEQGVLKMLRS